MRKVDLAERRARLARRHRLAPGERTSDVAEAAASVVCLHATDPTTVYLSAWARVEGMTIADMERALYGERSLVKHLAMRRTLFAFPRRTLAAAQAGASDRVAAAERRRLVRDVERAGLRRDGERWLREVDKRVLALLGDGREATAAELREEIPLLQGATTYGAGKPWGGEVPVGPRALGVLGASGRIVRASNDGGWTTARPRWAATEAWLGEPLGPPAEAEGLRTLVGSWLRAFGPGSEADIKWWLGSTVRAVRRALAELDAVAVDLGGVTGYLLPDDLEPSDPPEPWAALDPTTMGWAEREWYLGPHREMLFDRSGNAGPTVWWEGRIVGGWRQDESGDVVLQLLEDVGSDAQAQLEREAARLGEWLDGTRVPPRFPAPLAKRV